MLQAAAVIMNGQHLHPIGCFGPSLKKWRQAVDEALEKNLGAIDLSVSMGSVSPEVALRLGRLTGDVLRARKVSR